MNEAVSVPQRLLAVDDAVLVDYRQFYLRPFNSPQLGKLESPSALLYAGPGGAVFLSGGNHHYAGVRLELWSQEPTPDISDAWEVCETGMLSTDVPTLVFEGSGGRISSTRVLLPASGSYRIRAYCKGRDAAQDAEIGDDLKYPSGLESWLLQLWSAPETR